MLNKQKLYYLLFFSIFAVNVILFVFFLITNSYPFYAIALNILSVLTLLFWAIPYSWISYTKDKRIREVIVVVCLFLFALTVYLYKIDVVTSGIQGDEITIAKASEHILASSQFIPFASVNFGHPTPLLYLTGLSMQLFGRTIMGIRLPYVLFGALSIAAFYILLRMFFNKTISIAGSLLMLFSYPFIILSRLAYEVTPEIFFQIVTITFLTLAWKKKSIQYYVAVGLSLGLGFYTYVGFRTFALLIMLITSYLIVKSSKGTKTRMELFGITVVALFIAVIPLLSYGIDNPSQVMARTTALSAFTQNYSPTETGKELLANTGRLTHLFFMGDPSNSTNGDTNYTRNPSNVSMFDIGTFLFFVIGILFFFRTNRKLLLLIAILSISALVNDIFVIEKIPQALNPYGVGHPNTLRIAGIIPIIYFVIAYGVDQIRLLLKNKNSTFYYAVYVLLAIIVLYNWSIYFEQPTTGTFFSNYVNTYNGAYVMNIVNVVNKSNRDEVAVSPKFLSDERLGYFMKKGVTIKSYTPKNYSDAISKARTNQMTIFDPNSDTNLAIQILSQGQPTGLQISALSQSAIDPDHTIYAIVLLKTQ